MKQALKKEIDFQIRDKITLALACISSRFIARYTYESWGNTIQIMEKQGNAFGRLYWYHNDNTTVYLDMLSVDDKIRKQGIGTELQEMREEIGKRLGANISCLFVKKNTWMHDWYQRRGYIDCKNKGKSEVWMEKSLFSKKKVDEKESKSISENLQH